MHVLLIYTAFNIPLNVAFDQSGNRFMATIDQFIDYMFITDVMMNFIIGYEDEDRNSEFRLKKIAVKYVTSWFTLDLVACLPFDKLLAIGSTPALTSGVVNENESANKLLRLARLPRLYRLIRIVRLLRLLKMGGSFKKIFELMKINHGVSKLIGVLVTILFLIHMTACLWFWIADFS